MKVYVVCFVLLAASYTFGLEDEVSGATEFRRKRNHESFHYPKTTPKPQRIQDFIGNKDNMVRIYKMDSSNRPQAGNLGHFIGQNIPRSTSTTACPVYKLKLFSTPRPGIRKSIEKAKGDETHGNVNLKIAQNAGSGEIKNVRVSDLHPELNERHGKYFQNVLADNKEIPNDQKSGNTKIKMADENGKKISQITTTKIIEESLNDTTQHYPKDLEKGADILDLTNEHSLMTHVDHSKENNKDSIANKDVMNHAFKKTNTTVLDQNENESKPNEKHDSECVTNELKDTSKEMTIIRKALPNKDSESRQNCPESQTSETIPSTPNPSSLPLKTNESQKSASDTITTVNNPESAKRIPQLNINTNCLLNKTATPIIVPKLQMLVNKLNQTLQNLEKKDSNKQAAPSEKPTNIKVTISMKEKPENKNECHDYKNEKKAKAESIDDNKKMNSVAHMDKTINDIRDTVTIHRKNIQEIINRYKYPYIHNNPYCRNYFPDSSYLKTLEPTNNGVSQDIGSNGYIGSNLYNYFGTDNTKTPVEAYSNNINTNEETNTNINDYNYYNQQSYDSNNEFNSKNIETYVTNHQIPCENANNYYNSFQTQYSPYVYSKGLDNSNVYQTDKTFTTLKPYIYKEDNISGDKTYKPYVYSSGNLCNPAKSYQQIIIGANSPNNFAKNPGKLYNYTEKYYPGQYLDKIWRSWNNMDITVKNEGVPVKVEFGKDDKNTVLICNANNNYLNPKLYRNRRCSYY